MERGTGAVARTPPRSPDFIRRPPVGTGWTSRQRPLALFPCHMAVAEKRGSASPVGERRPKPPMSCYDPIDRVASIAVYFVRFVGIPTRIPVRLT